MTEDSVVALHHPGVTADPLTAVLRAGARELLAQAIEAEVTAVLAAHEHLKTEDGRRRLVRHGHGPERAILTGIGPVSVRRPKVRDRGSVGGERIRFTSAILPRFARRTRSLDAVLPTLYLRGVSSGDFQEALEALLGKDASGLSAQVIGRLKAEWEAEHERWRRRDLSARRYVYMWADGIYLQGRLEDEKQCILVLIGATPEGRKELVDFQGLCCKLGEGAMRDQGASCSPYDSALARRSCSHAMASVRAHGPRPKARSTIRASPTMPPWRANIPAWPLRSARITSKPLIVA